MRPGRTAQGAAKTGGGKVAPGAGREQWEVRKGVRPVIDGSEPVAAPADRFTAGADGPEFGSWFARTATPWKA